MRRCAITAALLFAATTVFAGPQFRVAGNLLSPHDALPASLTEWDTAIMPNADALGGWHWEVILNRFGFGMHYAARLLEDELAFAADYSIDWKGDLFLSYHFLGGGATIDPFVEFGWGGAGSARIRSGVDRDCPDLGYRCDEAAAVSLALFSYSAVGLALDLNGLLVGTRIAWIPSSLATPVPDASIRRYELPEFEVGLFAGVALGSHRSRHRRGRY